MGKTDSMSIHARLLIVIALIVLGSASRTWGNAGPSDTGATIVGEPTGIIDVNIVHETLTIDLRPLAVGNAAQIEAVYKLRNDGPEQELNLLFAFGSPNRDDWRVTLDGQQIPGELQQGASMPKEWWPPKTTPSLPGDDRVMTYAGAWRSVVPLAFEVIIPPGESELRVRYEEQGKTTFARPTMYRQFAYILAPARSWAGFGGLNVTIHVPKEWLVVCSPDLERDGSVWRGSFNSIPADSIGITLRPRIPAGYTIIRRTGLPLTIGMAVIGLGICWWCGGSRKCRKVLLSAKDSAATGNGDLSRSLAIGLLYAVAMLATGLFFTAGVDMIFPPDATELTIIRKLRLEAGYVRVFAVIILSLFSLAIGFVTALFASVRSRRVNG